MARGNQPADREARGVRARAAVQSEQIHGPSQGRADGDACGERVQGTDARGRETGRERLRGTGRELGSGPVHEQILVRQ